MVIKMIDIFVTVIDNYGDAGYTIRLASALQKTYQQKVRVITDYKKIFYDINDEIDFEILEIKDITNYRSSEKIVFMFQYFPNEDYIKIINKYSKICVTIDYFTPEKWAINSNNTMSYHHGLNIKNTFLVPGLYKETAGILNYSFFTSKIKGYHNVYMYTPEKVNFLNDPITLWGKKIKKENIKNMDISPQRIFDNYIYGAKYNWIRGEDSLQLALNSGIPFFWEAYKQKNQIHHLKVEAFLHFIKSFFEEEYLYNSYSLMIKYLNDYKIKQSIIQEYKNIDKNYNSLQKTFKKLKNYFQITSSLQENLIQKLEII
ncbi:hypothetical protein C7380_10322 [Oceanotoga teriensis]|uniref:Protein-arginine rhamnosyltransferase n=2 Tax=Oceanotoga teriensis TaxID=515440 RepID=A0AA45C861_9BACT|nr:hypothetical protein C7380_10322 [Oceanotoga teriensis]